MMTNTTINFAFLITLFFTLSACTTTPKPIDEKEFPRFHPKPIEQKSDIEHKPIALRHLIAWPEVKHEEATKKTEKLYSFIAQDMPIDKAMKLFSNAYNLNILLDNDVSGTINIEFRNLAFNLAMEAMLSSLGYYWESEDNLIRVRSWQTKLINIDYIRLNRVGAGSSEAQVSSGSSESGDSDSQAGKISIQQENKIEFWKELEEQLKTLVSEKGRLVINQIAGTVQISDHHARVVEVEQYLNEIADSIKRQVDIEVKILEVTLNDEFNLGVDWSRLVSNGNTGNLIDFNLNSIISNPVGTGTALPPVASVTASQISSSGENDLTALINALEEQGEVQIVSQPHIRTLNNQSALIKVGTDRTFFRREQNTDNTTAGSATTTTDVPQVVTEGIVLSITPQISKDGWIMMDVSPIVTRVSSVVEVKSNTGTVLSSAPNLDIRQTSSLVRAFNGDTVILGGLIQTQEANTNRGVPGLNKLPGVGGLFRGENNSIIKKELIIFLTPQLVNFKFPELTH